MDTKRNKMLLRIDKHAKKVGVRPKWTQYALILPDVPKVYAILRREGTAQAELFRDLDGSRHWRIDR